VAGQLLYVDTSALAKLVVEEPESEAVNDLLESWPLRVSSIVTWAELPRAALRKGHGAKASRRAEALLESIDLIELDVPLARFAARLKPATLRSLDAIHLASALSLGDDLGGFVAYDMWLTRSARAAGLRTLAPA
jgi:predicted nucleic acid-binding protein